MTADKRLLQAKRMLDESKFSEASEIYQDILAEGSGGAAEAAYNLGIMNQLGKGFHKSNSEALRFYGISSEMGHPMAKYRMASIWYGENKIEESLHLFDKISEENPSAAYWAYRITSCKDNKFHVEKTSSDYYLELAGRQGHILAKRIIAFRHLRGYYGLSEIPKGIALYFGALRELRKAINNGEKLKYT